MAVPNIFGTATAAIPLSQLDTNFATAITLGNTAVYLGNTTTSLGNVTLTNVTISSGNVTLTGANVSGTANVSTLVVTGNQTSLGNVAITGNISANIVTVAAGAVGTPSITTTGDTNTGIFFPAADTIAFAEGGAEAMRINSSGNVGIGTASPSDKLTVISAGTQVGSTNFRNISRIGLATNDASVLLGYDISAGSAILASTNNYPIAFWTSIAGTYAEKMRIDSSGNVGIGTSSPTGKLNVVTDNTHNDGATFDSTGTTQIWMRDTNSTANTKNWGFQISGGDFNILRANDDRATGFVTPVSFAQAPANSLIIDVSGNVGMGTASPSVKLDAVGATGIRVRYDTSGAGISLQQPVASGGDAYLLNQANNAFIFGTNNTERMRIDSSGNVLIGTTAINTISPRLTILGMTAGNQWSCGPTSGNDSFFIYNQSSVGVYLGYGNTSWSSSSDERIKTAIIPFENALEKVCTLRAGTGRYLTDEETVSRSFLIAQDVQAVLPEAVNVLDDEIGTLGLQYTDVIPLLVAAIKEQQALITALTARITALESI
jgi:hypothetical protein